MHSAVQDYLSNLHLGRLSPLDDSPASFSPATAARRPLEPPGHAVDCWYITTDPQRPVPGEAVAELSDDERERMERFKVAGHAERYLQTRLILRYVLAGYLRTTPTDVCIVTHPQGKPFVLTPNRSLPVHFNLSHSGDEFLLGISLDHEVGMDVEALQRRMNRNALAARFFHPAEKAMIDAGESEAEQLVRFFRCWTLKEAYVKAIGMGLRCPLSSFDISPAMENPNGCILDIDERRFGFISWQPTSDSIAAAAMELAQAPDPGKG